MKLAILAMAAFLVGIEPGLERYAGPPPPAPSPRQLIKQDQVRADAPLLTRLSETFKLRL